MSDKIGKNVQAIVSPEVHKTLKDIAYEKDVPLRDLICHVLTEYVRTIQKDA